MTDAEIKRRYHEIMSRECSSSTKVRTIKKTDRMFFIKKCPMCMGEGTVPDDNCKGWYVHYQYQDCNEQSGPHLQAEAFERYFGNKDKSCMMTLIGPDGHVYIED